MSSPQKLSDVKFIGYGSIIGILSGLSVWHYQHNHQVEMISLPPHINRHNMVLPNDFFRGNLSSPFTL
ncbi:MAG: hypothetical protein NTX57_09270, partial [Armatimonadetes bacterium]|nr:hypothetical protein [Armatimonadota bacterium]